MDLSVIIVNWNSAGYVRKCIASILAGTQKLKFEIIVIDSGSFDGCREMLGEEYPDVRFIQTDTNCGFARANNIGFKASVAKTILFLNPDTEVLGQAIEILYETVRSLPHPGAVVSRLLNSDL